MSEPIVGGLKEFWFRAYTTVAGLILAVGCM